MRPILIFIFSIIFFSCSVKKELNTNLGKRIDEVKLPSKEPEKVEDSLGFKIYYFKYQMPKIEGHQKGYYDLVEVKESYFVDTLTNKITKVNYAETVSPIFFISRFKLMLIEFSINRIEK